MIDSARYPLDTPDGFVARARDGLRDDGVAILDGFLRADVVDVMVRILTDEGAALINNIEKAQTPAPIMPQKYLNAQEWWWGLAQENSRVYTRRIVLNAKPL